MTARETYLDWNATAPLRPEAAAAVAEALALCGNPSSVHRRGRAARQRVEAARAAVAALVGASPDGVIFTSGGTEANHLALLGSGARAGAGLGGRAYLGACRPRRRPSASRSTATASSISPRSSAMLAADARPALVSVMLANNETGTIQPVRRDRRRSPMRTARCSIATRSRPPARSRCRLAAIGADLVTLSAHKIGGPAGHRRACRRPGLELTAAACAAAARSAAAAPAPRISAGIAGFAAAAAAPPIRPNTTACARLRDRLEAARCPRPSSIGADAPRLPNTSRIAMPGVSAETQIIALDLDGVMVSAGAACSSGKVGPEPCAGGDGARRPRSPTATIRVSLGWSTTEADIDHFIDAWTALYRRTAAARAAA